MSCSWKLLVKKGGIVYFYVRDCTHRAKFTCQLDGHTFVQPFLHGWRPKSHKCFTMVDRFNGWAPREILQGQWYLFRLTTWAHTSSHSQSFLSCAFMHLWSFIGNYLCPCVSIAPLHPSTIASHHGHKKMKLKHFLKMH